MNIHMSIDINIHMNIDNNIHKKLYGNIHIKKYFYEHLQENPFSHSFEINMNIYVKLLSMNFDMKNQVNVFMNIYKNFLRKTFR